MRRCAPLALAAALAGCGASDGGRLTEAGSPAGPGGAGAIDGPAGATRARIPRAPGEHAPSLVAIMAHRGPPAGPGGRDDVSLGTALADVDSCSTCHPDAAAQWAASAHSFASFGNPIYRANVEEVRATLGAEASRHCGGCHDLPLLVDGLLTAGSPIPAADLRSHSGVTCRLCHGIASTTHDGNASYAWSPAPLDAPDLSDAAQVARHRAQASARALGAELCVGCHRGFLSPDLGLPVHLVGVDEPGAWRGSAYTGNGMARIDRVAPRTCIDCHMEREPASRAELGAKGGTLASHRFLGGHTWMAAMRGDADHLRRTRAKLEGAASIDVAGALVLPAGAGAPVWHLPADGAPLVPGARVAFDVVIRNLLVGHRFPGGVLDLQDTWIEVEVTDRAGARLAASGLAHERDPADAEAHVLRTLVADEHGAILEEHQLARFRAPVASMTLAAREAQVVRYSLEVPRALAPTRWPLTVTARLRHRSRTLAMQAAACRAARTPAGRAFLAGGRGARDVDLDPCAPQPITLVADARVEVGAGAAPPAAARPAWERVYEHGMALVGTVAERLDEARAVLDAARAVAPTPRAQAMVIAQLGWVAARQGRADDALGLVAEARALLAREAPAGAPAPTPPVLDAIAADALARVWRWDEAVAPARACAERAPQNSAAWAQYARILASAGDDRGALAAAARGLDLAPRDPDLLRTQATALAALGRPEAAAALAAFGRFRAPDAAAEIRIRCAAGSARCARDREPAHTIPLRPDPGRQRSAPPPAPAHRGPASRSYERSP